MPAAVPENIDSHLGLLHACPSCASQPRWAQETLKVTGAAQALAPVLQGIFDDFEQLEEQCKLHLDGECALRCASCAAHVPAHECSEHAFMCLTLRASLWVNTTNQARTMYAALGRLKAGKLAEETGRLHRQLLQQEAEKDQVWLWSPCAVNCRWWSGSMSL